MRIATRPGSALVPRLLKLGLCLCIKPAKSVSRMCESACLPRVVNQARSRRVSVALVCRQAALHCTALHCIFLCHHASDARPALRLHRFESPPKRALLGTSSPPWSDAARHLGGQQISLDRCLHSLSLVAADGTIVHCELHSVSANQLARRRLFWLLARAFSHCPLATHDPPQLVNFLHHRHCLCLCAAYGPSTLQGRSHAITLPPSS
jgi:hypothetical protein